MLSLCTDDWGHSVWLRIHEPLFTGYYATTDLVRWMY
jgi:hypothetical protein